MLFVAKNVTMGKKIKEITKPKLHSNNKHIEGYDFQLLTKHLPELQPFVRKNEFNQKDTIDFANPEAVKLLNKALLLAHYDINYWDIPENYLCPPIPGRADYIHHVADLLQVYNYGNIPMGPEIKCLDIGTGANCIYPILGHQEYGWSFIGSDIDPVSLESAKNIISKNENLKDFVEIRLQENPKDLLFGAITKEEIIDVTFCNPPFHGSQEDALKGTIRKVTNLVKDKEVVPTLNFGGQSNELWCEGGEDWFVNKLIRESTKFEKNVFWFTTLVSKQSNLKNAYKTFEKYRALEVKTIPMGQGNKTSRIIAWTFLTKEEQKEWKNSRWNIDTSTSSV